MSKQYFPEPSEWIDMRDDMYALEEALDYVSYKQFNDHQLILYKIRLIQFIFVIQFFILTLFINQYK